MGLFSKRVHVTNAYASAFPLVDAKFYKNSLKESIISACNNDQSIVDNIFLNNTQGYPAKVRKYRYYGSNGYLYGIPRDSLELPLVDYDNLVAALTRIHTSSTSTPHVAIGYATYSEMHAALWAYSWMSQNFNDPVSHTLWNKDELVWNIPTDATSTSFVQVPNIPIVEINTAGNVEIYYALPAGGKISVAVTTIPAELQHRKIYQVVYRLDTDTHDQYWFYDPTTHLHPELVDIPEIDVRGEYLPVALLMVDTVSYLQDKSLIWYSSTEKLLKTVSIPGEDIYKEVMKADSQPAEKTDLFVHYSAPIKCTTNGTKTYIYEYFKHQQRYQNTHSPTALVETFNNIANLETIYGTSSWDRIDSVSSDLLEIGSSRLKFSIRGPEGYNVAYAWGLIGNKIHKGKVLAIGKTDLTLHKDNAAWIAVFGANNAPKAMFLPSLLLTHQLNDSFYEQVVVVGLAKQYTINTVRGPRQVTNSLFEEKEPSGYHDLASMFQASWGDPDTNLDIPIHWGILQNLNPVDKEFALQEALRGTLFLTHSYSYKKATWFGKLLAVVIIVVTIVFAPQLAGAITGLLGSTLAAAAVIAAAHIAIGFALNWAFSALGLAELAPWLTALTMFYVGGGFAMLANGGFGALIASATGSWHSILNTIAQVTSMLGSIHQKYTQKKILQIQQELESFLKSAKEKQEDLENKFLEFGDNLSNPLDFIEESISYFYESPDQFFNRTLMTNPGAANMELIPNFTKWALTLPEAGRDPNPLFSVNQQMLSRG